MNVRKFVAPTSRDALHRVKSTLGPDAIILSNRPIAGGVEMMAMSHKDATFLSEAASSFPTRESKVDLIENDSVTQSIVTPPPTADMGPVMDELRSMRSMLEAQITELSWNSMHQRQPHKAQVMKELLRAGFSAYTARFLTSKMPIVSNFEEGMAWLRNVLTANVATLMDEGQLLDEGGIFALVGPTGVGKTTTIAKMAARTVMRHGPGKLGLITTDGFRIGGYEQLRIYGKILGVMVHSVKDDADLSLALDEFKNKQTILIDTAGVGQRDDAVAGQIAMLAGTGRPVQRLLCLNATSTGETLSEVVRAFSGPGLAGCVMTKLDEATCTGNILDTMLRNKLKLFYVANGQKVPEDIEVPDKDVLVKQVFSNMSKNKNFALNDDELSIAITAGMPQPPTRPGGVEAEGSRG